MELLIYLLKSVAILTLFYFVYLIVLQKDTFFTSNRRYLMGGIITSLLLPLVIFTKTVYIDAPVISSFQNYNNIMIQNSPEAIQQVSFNWGMLMIAIYSIGILFMSFRFIFQLFSVYKIIQKYTSTKKNGYHYIKVNEDINPFSFFKYIVYNPEKHSETELEMILKHEQSHASQLHSIDIILSNLLLIFQWINPFAWLYKKSIEENLEFIADSETAQKTTSIKDYQLTLLKTISPTTLQPTLANNFYQSLIKKRIVMLHKNQSSAKKQWKLLLILPFLGIFLWSFNVKEKVKYNIYPTTKVINTASTKTSLVKEEPNVVAISEEKVSKKITKKKTVSIPKEETTPIINSKIIVTINKNTTNVELEMLKKLFKNSYNITLKFNGVKRNNQNEITAIKVKMKSENANSSFNVNDEYGIKEFSILYDNENDAISIGNNNTYQKHVSSSSANAYVYEINKNTNKNVNSWISGGNAHVVKGKSKYVIHTANDNIKQEIRVISEDGNKSKVWVSKGGNASKNEMQTIIVKRNEESSDDESEERIFIIRTDSSFIDSNNEADSIFVRSGNKSGIFISDTNDDNMVVYINGKKSTKETMDQLDSEKISTIEVLKGEVAVKKYGEEAKDGVILITTKKN